MGREAPLSAAAAAAARAEAHKARRIEEVRQTALREGWAAELLDQWPGGDRKSLVQFLDKGNTVAIRFQSAIRAKKARKEVGERLKVARAKRAEDERQAQEEAEARAAAEEATFLAELKLQRQVEEAREAAKSKLMRDVAAGVVGGALACIALMLLYFVVVASPIGRCHGASPAPIACARGWALPSSSSSSSREQQQQLFARAPTAQNRAMISHWRQRVECCDLQILTLPVPSGAEFLDVVGVQWRRNSVRSISFQRLLHAGRLLGGDRTLSFGMPWDVVGPNGCLPNPHRSCQYGDTKYVEMAAVQVSCPEADAWLRAHEANYLVEELEEELALIGGEVTAETQQLQRAARELSTMPLCHTVVEWSWGNESLTLPRDAHGPLGSHRVLFLASFHPEFNEPVPLALPSEVSRNQPLPPT